MLKRLIVLAIATFMLAHPALAEAQDRVTVFDAQVLDTHRTPLPEPVRVWQEAEFARADRWRGAGWVAALIGLGGTAACMHNNRDRVSLHPSKAGGAPLIDSGGRVTRGNHCHLIGVAGGAILAATAIKAHQHKARVRLAANGLSLSW